MNHMPNSTDNGLEKSMQSLQLFLNTQLSTLIVSVVGLFFNAVTWVVLWKDANIMLPSLKITLLNQTAVEGLYNLFQILRYVQKAFRYISGRGELLSWIECALELAPLWYTAYLFECFPVILAFDRMVSIASPVWHKTSSCKIAKYLNAAAFAYIALYEAFLVIPWNWSIVLERKLPNCSLFGVVQDVWKLNFGPYQTTISIILMVVLNGTLILTLKKRIRQNAQKLHWNPAAVENERKMQVKMIAIIVAISMNFIFMEIITTVTFSYMPQFSGFGNCVQSLSTAVNPLVYCFAVAGFRRKVFNLLPFCNKTSVVPLVVTSVRAD